MKKAIAFLIIMCAALSLGAAFRQDDFIRGIVYYLLNDMELSREYLDTHFKEYPQPDIRLGFTLLLGDQRWESTRRFNNYLENSNRQRSPEVLVGVSLALSDQPGNQTVENLNKALRLSFNYVPALICLGSEYLKKRNYPEAEMILQKAMQYSPVAEPKILLGKFYLETGQPRKAMELARPEADALPQNFHFNRLTAEAALEMGQFELVSHYVSRCLRIKPQSPEAMLLQGKTLLRQKEWKKARSVLEKLRFNYYNPDWAIAISEALVRLDDSDAEKYLYELYTQDKWHPRLNRLFAAYFAGKKKGNAQNWINRSILAGVSREEMQKEVGGGYQFPQYPSWPFFEVKKICWLDAGTLAVAGRSRSGESEGIYIVTTNPLAVSKPFVYNGTIQEFFPARSPDRLVFSTTVVENDRTNVYVLQGTPKKYALKAMSPSPLRIGITIGVYSEDWSEFLFTDGGFPSLAFESPFSVVGERGQRLLLYPQFTFPVYSYSFASGVLTPIRDAAKQRRIPIVELKKYFMVADAFASNQDIQNQIRKGQGLELTSSDFIKIHFADDLSAFIIYYADLNNAFQAIVFHAAQNKAYRVDETMFLGKKKYAELNILRFDTIKKEIYVLTKDKDRELIRFNYASLLYEPIRSAVVDFLAPPSAERLFFLTEKKRYLYYTDTTLETLLRSTNKKEKLSSRNDFVRIIGMGNGEQILLSTYNGEIVKLNEDNSFSGVQVSLEGVPSAVSPDRKQAAAFVTGKLYLLKWL